MFVIACGLATKLNKCRCKSRVIFTAAARILIFTAQVGLIVQCICMCICVLLYLCIVYFHSGCRNIDLHGWSGSYCASWSPAIEKDLSIQICHTLAYLYLYIFHRGPTSTYSGLHSTQICRFYDRHRHTYSLKGRKAHSVSQTHNKHVHNSRVSST